jgi:hypothetical protein
LQDIKLVYRPLNPVILVLVDEWTVLGDSNTNAQFFFVDISQDPTPSSRERGTGNSKLFAILRGSDLCIFQRISGHGAVHGGDFLPGKLALVI